MARSKDGFDLLGEELAAAMRRAATTDPYFTPEQAENAARMIRGATADRVTVARDENLQRDRSGRRHAEVKVTTDPVVTFELSAYFPAKRFASPEK
jgi:hypothetical protein